MRRRFKSRSAVIGSALIAALVVGVGVIAVAGASPGGSASGGGDNPKKKPLKLEDSNVFLEINGTDGDAGIHLELGGEPWSKLRVADPGGRRILDIRAKSKLGNHGLSGIFIESAEPGFDELSFKRFKRRFPEGKYRITGETTAGRALRGNDKLSHAVPKEPAVTFPTDGGTVDRNGFVFRWDPPSDKKVEIVRYQLTVSNEDAKNGEVIIEVGPNRTSATIGGEYLSPGDTYAAELIALEKSGNQTISALEFKTSG